MLEQDKIEKIATSVVNYAIREVKEAKFPIEESNMIALISSLSSSLAFNLVKNLKFSHRVENRTFFAKVMWSTNKNIYKIVEKEGIDNGEVSISYKKLK